ncbi:VCBS repeat protein [Murinocardiopsis flavida]|uniref:VCBS repeat protein n=1 Tax=Murinocardiopsis flavida TaxID=645275 RepID=A0A2P8DDV6_9ACTN|nr:VCBS repeat-containing protein [Murinocardiopsis flavida]PSK95414.1 VCBS repeat protein [Murinocardiopsis flavida]
MRISTLTAAACTGTLLLSACGAEDPGDRPAARTSPVATPPGEAAPIPEGNGGDRADDVNGDGYPDLVFTSDYSAEAGQEMEPAGHLAVVYGAKNGLDPATRTVLPATGLGFGPAGDSERLRPAAADLDGDGFADIPALESDNGFGAAEADPPEAAVIWGGPRGPEPDAEPTPIATGEGQPVDQAPAVGDFDGDGAADLAVTGTDSTGTASSLRVLRGPFDRDGTPADTASIGLPEDVEPGSLLADEIDGDRATNLLVQHISDGEQAESTLYTGGPDGLSGRPAATLAAGNMAAFGDFDGDGTRDIAVGDDGTRNNEPGYETEAPEVHRKLNVYYGTEDGIEEKPEASTLPGSSDSASYGLRTMVAGDFDGAKGDELAVGRDARGVEVLTGTEDGLRRSADSTPLKRTGPAKGPEGKVNKEHRLARAFAAGDYDGDGTEELVLAYDPSVTHESPVQWWVTDGRNDKSAFTSAPFTE